MPGGGHACSAPALGCKTQDGPGDGRLGELGLIRGGGAATEDGPGRKRGVPEPASPGGEGERPRGRGLRLGDLAAVTAQRCRGCSSPRPHAEGIAALMLVAA